MALSVADIITLMIIDGNRLDATKSTPHDTKSADPRERISRGRDAVWISITRAHALSDRDSVLAQGLRAVRDADGTSGFAPPIGLRDTRSPCRTWSWQNGSLVVPVAAFPRDTGDPRRVLHHGDAHGCRRATSLIAGGDHSRRGGFGIIEVTLDGPVG